MENAGFLPRSGPEPWLRAQDTPGLHPRGPCGAGRCPGFPGGGGWGVPGPQSIRWALSNLPELPCTWPFSCPWGPRDYCRERPRCLGQPEPGTVNSPEGKLSWAKNPGVTPETSGGEVGGGGQRGREGNVNVQHPELAPGGRPGSYCPEPPAHGAGAHPGRFRSSPGRQRQGAVSEGRRPVIRAHCPVRFTCFLSPTHMIQINGH